MSTKQKVNKVKTALGMIRLSTPQLIANGAHYVQQMTGNTYFPAPNPTLASVTAEIGVLDAAYNLSLTRVKGSVTAMHLERTNLQTLLGHLAAYAEAIANADPANAAKILQSTGMPLKKPSTHLPKIFTVINGKLKGSVVIDCKAIRGGTYIYQMTTDPNTATSWSTIYTGGKVKFTKTGLSSGTKYYFRMSTSVKGVQSDWSHELELVVQ